MRRCSSKANKLKYVHTIRGAPRDIAIKEREIYYIKIKIIPFIIYFVETIPLFIEFKSKKDASVSVEFALFS